MPPIPLATSPISPLFKLTTVEPVWAKLEGGVLIFLLLGVRVRSSVPTTDSLAWPVVFGWIHVFLVRAGVSQFAHREASMPPTCAVRTPCFSTYIWFAPSVFSCFFLVFCIQGRRTCEFFSSSFWLSVSASGVVISLTYSSCMQRFELRFVVNFLAVLLDCACMLWLTATCRIGSFIGQRHLSSPTNLRRIDIFVATGTPKLIFVTICVVH